MTQKSRKGAQAFATGNFNKGLNGVLGTINAGAQKVGKKMKRDKSRKGYNWHITTPTIVDGKSPIEYLKIMQEISHSRSEKVIIDSGDEIEAEKYIRDEAHTEGESYEEYVRRIASNYEYNKELGLFGGRNGSRRGNITPQQAEELFGGYDDYQDFLDDVPEGKSWNYNQLKYFVEHENDLGFSVDQVERMGSGRKGGPTIDQVYDLMECISDAREVTDKYFDGYDKEFEELTPMELTSLFNDLKQRYPSEYKDYVDSTNGAYLGGRRGSGPLCDLGSVSGKGSRPANLGEIATKIALGRNRSIGAPTATVEEPTTEAPQEQTREGGFLRSVGKLVTNGAKVVGNGIHAAADELVAGGKDALNDKSTDFENVAGKIKNTPGGTSDEAAEKAGTPAGAQAGTQATGNKDIASRVMNGEFGNGEARTKALTDAGYDPQEVQSQVNSRLSKKGSRKGFGF